MSGLCLIAMFMLAPLAWTQAPPAAAKPDTTKHKVTFVTVAPGVKLEMLDFGGTGRPMIFLAALGPDAHDWDNFAPKFTDHFHVYALSRRGFGASDVPAPTNENYDSDRLGDDVLAVMDQLKLEKPILVGWSVGGAELSSVGSRYPERVTALVYLDAAYPYAFYNEAARDPLAERAELRRLLTEASHSQPMPLDLEQRLLASVQVVQKELADDVAKRQKSSDSGSGPPPMPPQIISIMTNTRKYTKIHVPILAIFAVPVDLSYVKDPVERERVAKSDTAFRMQQMEAVQAGLPQAKVIAIAGAGHDVFTTNEAEVLRVMLNFLEPLVQR